MLPVKRSVSCEDVLQLVSNEKRPQDLVSVHLMWMHLTSNEADVTTIPLIPIFKLGIVYYFFTGRCKKNNKKCSTGIDSRPANVQKLMAEFSQACRY